MEKNGEASLSFTGTRKTHLFLPTSINLDPDSENSLDKIQIYDEMQERMADYLETKQQVGSLQNQISIFKQRLLQMESEYNQKQQDMQETINDLEHQNEMLQKANNQLNATIDELQDENNKLHEEIIRLENRNQNDHNSRKDAMDRALKDHENHYKTIISTLEREVNKYKDQASMYQMEYSTCHENLKKRTSDYEKLQSDYFELHNRCELAEAEQKDADERCKTLRAIIKQQKEESFSFDQLHKTQSEKLSKLEKTLDEKMLLIKQTVKEREELQSKLTKIMELLPEYDDFQEFVEKLKERVEISEALPIELRKLKKKLQNAMRALKISDAKFSESEIKLNEQTEKAEKLKNELETTNTQNSDIVGRFKVLLDIKKNTDVIESSNRELVNRMHELTMAIDENRSKHSLRNLILFSLVIKRWKSIVGKPKEYISDTRNWWWLCNTTAKFNLHEKVKEIMNENSSLHETVKKLNDEISQLHEENITKETEIAAKDTQIYRQQEELKDKMIFIQDLETKIHSMIEPDVFADKEFTLRSTKGKLAETLKALSKTTEELVILRHECSVLKHIHDTSSSSSKLTIQENENLKKSVLTLTNQVNDLKAKLTATNEAKEASKLAAQRSIIPYINSDDIPGHEKVIISCSTPGNMNFFY